MAQCVPSAEHVLRPYHAFPYSEGRGGRRRLIEWGLRWGLFNSSPPKCYASQSIMKAKNISRNVRHIGIPVRGSRCYVLENPYYPLPFTLLRWYLAFNISARVGPRCVAGAAIAQRTGGTGSPSSTRRSHIANSSPASRIVSGRINKRSLLQLHISTQTWYVIVCASESVSCPSKQVPRNFTTYDSKS